MRYLLLILLGLTSCSSPQESLEKKDYEAAYKSSLRQLRNNKSYEKNKEILVVALKEIIDKNRGKTDALKKTKSIENYKKAITINTKLLNKLKESSDFTSEVNTFKDVAAALEQDNILVKKSISDQYLKSGIINLETYQKTKKKDQARKAYNNFNKSKEYGNESLFLDSLSNESLQLGQVVYTIETSTFFNISHSFEINQKLDDLTWYSTKFRKIYFNSAISKEEVDCEVEISFSSLDIDKDKNEEEEKVEKEIKTIETVTNSDGIEEEVETTSIVTATVITEEVTKVAKWKVSIDVNGSINCNISDTDFEESLVSEIKRISFEGDERAAPSIKNSIIKEELMTDDEMKEELLKRIYDEIANHLF